MEKKISNWVKKVLAKLNLNDEGKVLLFQSSMINYFKAEIEKLELAIKKNDLQLKTVLLQDNMELEELKVLEDEIFINIDQDKIQNAKAIKSYVEEISKAFNSAIEKRKYKEEEIESKIKETEDVNKILQDSIDLYKSKIKLIED